MSIQLLPYALIILPIAVWRLTSLIVYEDGPWAIFATFRYWAGVRVLDEPPFDQYGTNSLARGLICFWCASVWVGILAVLYWLVPMATLVVAFPLFLSAVAIFVDKFVEK